MSDPAFHSEAVAGNGTLGDARFESVGAVFEQQVRLNAGRIAYQSTTECVTYDELNRRANRVAWALRALSSDRNQQIGVYFRQSVGQVAALLGILKAGTTAVLLDPNAPEEVTRATLADTEARWVLAERSNAEAVRGLLGPNSDLLVDGDFEEPFSDRDPDWVVPAETPACLIFTSGSTGQPKGVIRLHRNFVWTANAGIGEPARLPNVRFCFLAAHHTGHGTSNLFRALLRGETVLAFDLRERGFDRLAEWLMEQRATVFSAAASVFRRFVQTLTPDQRFPDVRLVRLGNEKVLRRDFESFRRHFAESCQLINVIGCTESSNFALHRVTHNVLNDTDTVPIGRPIAGVDLRLLDDAGREVGVDQVGEITVDSPGVAAGYWRRPELTARFFRRSGDATSDCRYHTGDFAMRRQDGCLVYCGRRDFRVKIRGIGVDLQGVEAALGNYPGIRHAAVTVRESSGSEPQLVAFIVGASGRNPDPAQIRRQLRQQFSEPMLPGLFVAIDAMPLTSNGKVDRKALETLAGVELTSGAGYVAPRNERERTLVEIWQATLCRDPVGIHDNFFDLGGHSLLAMGICSQITRRLNVEVPVGWMFEHSTIETLAQQMESLRSNPHNTRSIETADRHQPLPMSFGQQGLWLLQQTLPDLAIYNQPVAFRLSGRVDRERVRRALRVILERHEILRTALVQEGASLLQQVAAAQDVPLPWLEVDLPAGTASERNSTLEECLMAAARRPFDLTKAPLWRVVWIPLGKEEHVLGMTFHHSIVDKWTQRLFLAELERLYNADGPIEPARLPELPVQYADFAAWQRQRLTGDLLEEQRRYWREQLQNLPAALELPTDSGRPVNPSGRGADHDFQLPEQVVIRLQGLAREERTTLFTVMLAAFQVWLHRYTGQTDVIVATPVANRSRPEIQSSLGYFLNTLPMRLRVDGSTRFRQVVRHVREALVGAFNHAELPFEQMVEMAVKGRAGTFQPLYQVMFVLMAEGLPVLKLKSAETRPLAVDTKTSKCDLTLSIRAVGQTLECRFEYATDLFGAETAGRMGRHLSELLRSSTEDPEKPIHQLDLMPEAERQQVLVEWNQTERDTPRDECVHHLFETQVARTPEAVAVEFNGQSLCYADLNRRANQLAHHLRSLGAGSDEPVALILDRSLDLAVGLLGILKAGSGYVPLDPSYPAERLRFMFDDSGCRLLVTSRRVADALPVSSAQRVILEELPPGLPDENPSGHARPDALAYLMYTSGSTGQPKGVVMEHRPLMNLVAWQLCQSGPARRTLQFASASFDVSFQEIFATWLSGGELVLVPQNVRSNPAQLWDLIVHRRVERLFLPGVVLEQLAEILEDSAAEAKALKEVIAAGDKLRITPAIRSMFERHPAATLCNQYGPTETHVVTSFRLPADVDAWPVLPSIGRPIANVRAYVLDACLHPLPIGVPGELFLGGAQVARGYRNRPELTSEKFVPDPFRADLHARLYRSGDRCRWLPDGNLEFLGRLDNQVKIRGFRIELGEIEAWLRAEPEVREAVVLLREDTPGDRRLVAYLVAHSEEKPDGSTLRTRLGSTLPDYMLPNAFVWLHQLPLTPNGKLDRKALPAPETGVEGRPGDTDQPTNILELELLRLWRRLFHREDLGRHDNFFDLGGHSLLAARLTTDIDKLLGCKLPISALFQSPTVASLTRRLTAENWTPPWKSLVPLQPLGAKPPFLLVHGWGGDVFVFLGLAQQLAPDQPAYGLQAVGLDGKSARHTSLEHMAAHYVQEIRSFQPEGPYYLGGYSMGGLIAFEMAQQLHHLGQRVALLALFDTVPICAIPWTVYGRVIPLYLCRRLMLHLRRGWKMPNQDRRAYFQGRWVALQHWIFRNRSRPSVMTVPATENGPLPQVPGFADYYLALALAYRLRHYPGSADLFVSDDTKSHWMSSWKKLVGGGVSYHGVPGTHLQLLTPNSLPVLSHALRTALKRAQGSEEPTGETRLADANTDGNPVGGLPY